MPKTETKMKHHVEALKQDSEVAERLRAAAHRAMDTFVAMHMFHFSLQEHVPSLDRS